MRRLALVAAVGLVGLAPGAAEAARAPVVKCLVKPAQGDAGVKAAAAAKRCRRLPARPAAAAAGAGARMSRGGTPPAAPSAPNAPAVPAVPAVPAPTAPAAPTRLGVVAREFSLLLSRTTLPAGAAVVELTNRGEDAHNLRLERAGSAPLDVPLAESGEVTKASGTLTPGEWRVLCALPGHEEAGMHARLTVQAP